MKRLIVILCILAGVALLLFIPYMLLQQRATRMMNERLRHSLGGVVANPQNLTLTNTPIRLSGGGQVKIPEIRISGNELNLRRPSTSNPRTSPCATWRSTDGKRRSRASVRATTK